MLLVVTALLVMMLISLVQNLRRYPAGSWRRDAWRKLRALRQRASTLSSRELAEQLSELLRRIAVAGHGRDRVAALSGERWLAWLQEHDPTGFDWQGRGRPLLTLPYAPPGAETVDRKQLLPLIDAAMAWTERSSRSRHV